ncbi:MAG TPA: outer membrane beta-barrel domain-containing protein [Gammaproteobacteria bacterium]|nr:outer membrane beta-barrel domain-containing protein [Gammaproteobacteria bacterium]
MESRIRRFFLMALAPWLGAAGLYAPAPALCAEGEQVIKPEIERREVREVDIDTEDFEVGAFAGAMNVENFGTNFVYGARLAYHVTEYIFVEGAYGHTSTSKTSFEKLSGSAQLLEDKDRDLDYYNVSFGLNILPGESFIGEKWAFTTDFFLIGGAGSTSFAGEDEFTWNVGAGYKVLLNDWLAVRIDGRDHVFDVNVLGKSETQHNLEFTGGISIFF